MLSTNGLSPGSRTKSLLKPLTRFLNISVSGSRSSSPAEVAKTMSADLRVVVGAMVSIIAARSLFSCWSFTAVVSQPYKAPILMFALMVLICLSQSAAVKLNFLTLLAVFSSLIVNVVPTTALRCAPRSLQLVMHSACSARLLHSCWFPPASRRCTICESVVFRWRYIRYHFLQMGAYSVECHNYFFQIGFAIL